MGLWLELDRREKAVDPVGAFGEDLVLPAPEAARAEERLGVLEVVMIVLVRLAVADRGGDDVALAQRRPVVHGDDPDLVVGAVDDDRGEAFLPGDLGGDLLGSRPPRPCLRPGGNRSPRVRRSPRTGRG